MAYAAEAVARPCPTPHPAEAIAIAITAAAATQLVVATEPPAACPTAGTATKIVATAMNLFIRLRIFFLLL
jgi:hypothetical protein